MDGTGLGSRAVAILSEQMEREMEMESCDMEKEGCRFNCAQESMLLTRLSRERCNTESGNVLWNNTLGALECVHCATSSQHLDVARRQVVTGSPRPSSAPLSLQIGRSKFVILSDMTLPRGTARKVLTEGTETVPLSTK